MGKDLKGLAKDAGIELDEVQSAINDAKTRRKDEDEAPKENPGTDPKEETPKPEETQPPTDDSKGESKKGIDLEVDGEKVYIPQDFVVEKDGQVDELATALQYAKNRKNLDKTVGRQGQQIDEFRKTIQQKEAELKALQARKNQDFNFDKDKLDEYAATGDYEALAKDIAGQITEKNQAESEHEKKVQQTQREIYDTKVQAFLKQNPDAEEMWDDMKSVLDNLSDEEKQMWQGADPRRILAFAKERVKSSGTLEAIKEPKREEGAAAQTSGSPVNVPDEIREVAEQTGADPADLARRVQKNINSQGD